LSEAEVADGCEVTFHPAASARLQKLADEYARTLAAQATLVAERSGAVQVSAKHVERAYHLVHLANPGGRREAGKLFSGALVGAGLTMLTVGLEATPVIVWLTLLGVTGCVGGVAMMGWVAARPLPG
jgi:hypothetical protein